MVEGANVGAGGSRIRRRAGCPDYCSISRHSSKGVKPQMRLNTSSKQYKPGAVRSRGQWTVFGLAVGIIAALALRPDTAWIVRHELEMGLPGAESRVDQVSTVEQTNRG